MKKSIVLVGLSYALDNYMSSHVELLSNNNDVTLLAVDKHPKLSRFFHRRSLFTAPMEMVFLLFFLLRHRTEICISVGPKLGGMLSIVCTVINVKHAHWFTGQVWCNSRKPKLMASYWCDRLIIANTPILLCDGPSQIRFMQTKFEALKQKKIYSPKYGSINGVPDIFFGNSRRQSIEPLKICYVGRKAKGKGLELIAEIASRLGKETFVEFVLAGPTDISFQNYADWKADVEGKLSNISFIDDFIDPIEIFKISNVLILPSEREGFGSVVIEAQSMGLPVICSDIYGLNDAFIDKTTGFKCKQDSVEEYVNAILSLSKKEIYSQMSENAREFSRNFKHECFMKDLLECYVKAGVLN